MNRKRRVYFVTLSSNAPYVLKEALELASKEYEVMIFFDLDGSKILDKRYLNQLEKLHGLELTSLIQSALDKGIKFFGCQMNVLIAEGLELLEGVELAGVATFLDLAYEAEAVMSY